MPYSQDAGYTPSTIQTIMNSIRGYINAQFLTNYTAETFVGTNFYKYFYALAQRVQEGEVKTSEVFVKLQQYIAIVNERISRPVVTPPGLIEKLFLEDYIASVKPPEVGDAGKIYVAVDVDDGVHATGWVRITSYANLVSGTDDVVTIDGTAFTAQTGSATPGTGTFQAATSNSATATSLATQINAHATASTKVRARAVGAVVYLRAVHGGTAANAYTLAYTDNDTNVGATKSGSTLSGGAANDDYADLKTEIATLLSSSVVGGVISQGTESETIVLSNGQSFDWKYNLPERIPIQLRLTITLSENNQVVVGDPDETKELLLENIQARYKLGKNFEPQRYFGIVDAPWAESVLLEWAEKDPVATTPTYSSAVFETNYDQLFDISLEDIELVES